MRKLFFCLLTLLAPCFGTDCTPAGTWFGGSEPAKYLLTVVPNHSDYTVVFQAAFKPRVPILTRYSGEMKHVKAKTFEIHSIAMVNMSELPPEPGGEAGSPQVWAIRALSELTDCNTLDIEIDFFAAYLWRDDLAPYKDMPDSHRLPPGTTLREKYRRMVSDTCTACPVRQDDKSPSSEAVFIGATRDREVRRGVAGK